MQCDRCGGEEHETFRTIRCRTVDGGFSKDCDVRRYRCLSCGLVTHVECRKVRVEVFDHKTKGSILVTPSEYLSTYFDKDYTSPAQIRMFKDPS